MPTILAKDRRPEAPHQPIGMPLKPSSGLFLEHYGPGAVALIAGVSVLWVPALWLLHAKWRELLLDKMLDIQIGLLAGLLAIVAFLPAIEEKTVIRKLKQFGWYRYLVGYLKEAVFVSGVAVLMSVMLIVVPDSWNTNIRVDRVLSSVWWALVVYSCTTAFRIVKLALKSLLAE